MVSHDADAKIELEDDAAAPVDEEGGGVIIAEVDLVSNLRIISLTEAAGTADGGAESTIGSSVIIDNILYGKTQDK